MLAAVLLTFIISGLLASSGCSTASSLGLPVSSGSHRLLSSANDLREKAGHRRDISRELAKEVLPSHRVEAGDVLEVEPNDFNSPVRLPSDQTVQSDGTIDLGTYGRMQVAGGSVPEIQQQVQTQINNIESRKRRSQLALASYPGKSQAIDDSPIDYGVTVRLVNQDSSLYYVMGEVNSPGSYPLLRHETVLDAIIAAGGLSSRANEHKLILTRPRTDDEPRVVLPICYQQIIQLGVTDTNYQLRPGDRIYIPSLSLWEDIKQSVQYNNEKSCPFCRDFQAK